MDIPRLTDERLRTALNTNQSARERMCLAVLALDRNYSDIHPRRPEGGPDGSRDIQCLQNSQLCFGAVGFQNSAVDSSDDKKWVYKKFKADLKAAQMVEPNLPAFVFFTNVDLTPGEIKELTKWATDKKVNFVDIYYRERIRITLDSAEGLGLRFQYLGIELSAPEQAAFFSRFGNDLEKLVTGRLDTIEKKIDQFEFNTWKVGFFKEIRLELEFKEWISSGDFTEHFRVCLELQSVEYEKRSILIGGRDEHMSRAGGGLAFASKAFFWRQAYPKQEPWIPQHIKFSGGEVSGIRCGAAWKPRSNILIEEFVGLRPRLFITENLVNLVASVKFSIDSYIVLAYELKPDEWKKGQPYLSWPGTLTEEEEKIEWRRNTVDPWQLELETVPKKIDKFRQL